MTVLDAFDLAVGDDAELGRRAAAGDARARRELIDRYRPARAQARACATAVPLRLRGLRRMVDERHNRRGDGMTSRRARAYARVTMTLDNLGPAKLLGPEQAQIRHVADTLLSCADLPNDASARAELAGVEALLEHLVACGRWRPERAGSLGDDVWACGPGPDAFHLLAA